MPVCFHNVLLLTKPAYSLAATYSLSVGISNSCHRWNPRARSDIAQDPVVMAKMCRYSCWRGKGLCHRAFPFTVTDSDLKNVTARLVVRTTFSVCDRKQLWGGGVYLEFKISKLH